MASALVPGDAAEPANPAGVLGTTSKHILVPVWVLSFTYRATIYQVLVNGHSGAIAGDYPLSRWKVFVLIVVILIMALTFIVISQE